MVQPSGAKILLHIVRPRGKSRNKRERERNRTQVFNPYKLNISWYSATRHTRLPYALFTELSHKLAIRLPRGGDFLYLCPLGLGGLEYCGFLAYTLTIPVGLLADRLASEDSWGTGNSCVADREGKVADMGDA